MTDLPGASNPTDRLSCDGPTMSTGDSNAEIQLELFSRLGRDAPALAVLAAVSNRWSVRGGRSVRKRARGGG